MNREQIRKLLEDVRNQRIGVETALESLKNFPYRDIGFAKLDTHRHLRCGFPEVVFCQGKTVDQIVAIVETLASEGQTIMATLADRDVYDAIKKSYGNAKYHEAARIVVVGPGSAKKTDKQIAVISAGTSDIPVAEQAVVTAEVMGNPVERLYDIGVAGIHRLLDNKDKLFGANVLIVVAGMEGALASVVGGMVDRPVIAVPTSVGYGANFHGLSALLSMLNCCAPGVAVVNIDNGFGAGYYAGIINLMGDQKVKILYFDCFAGVSGDMILGALVDAGLPLGDLKQEVAKLNLAGYTISAAKAVKHGITGTKVNVETQQQHAHRRFKDIEQIIDASDLSEDIKAACNKVFENLAAAEPGSTTLVSREYIFANRTDMKVHLDE